MKPDSKSIITAVIQQKCFPNKKKSLELSIKLILQAAEKGAKLILLPELHGSHYFCQTEDVANFAISESIPGPTTDKLTKIAKKHQVIIVCSIFEKRAAGLYHNTAVVIDADGSIAGKYRKMHIPDDPGYYEKFYFTPGDLGFEPVTTSVGKLGVLVCWDQWYPEAARLMALKGANILLYPTAIGWDNNDPKEEKLRQFNAWKTVQQAHAIANNLPVMVSNRIGFEDSPDNNTGIQFWGSSFIAGPQGEILNSASCDDEHIVLAKVDFAKTETIRQMWPFLRDRRIDAYQNLLKRYID